MKSILSKIHWYMPMAVLLIFVVACMPQENTSPRMIQDTEIEKAFYEPFENPLENLRMNPEMLKMLASIRENTAKYHRLEVAEADGYETGSDCVSHPEDGGMGYHFVNFALVDEVFDPSQPEALLYELAENGELRLVGAEFIIAAAPWDQEHEGIPYFGEQAFDDHRDFLKMGGPQFPHYQLHAWVWKHNPSGIFAKFNPRVECEPED
ncbi:hypothetical protein [Algoriphagus sp. CAU 1675]|uniref:hypothetical protein n=1 Tax=Algoriphagus sp. CAU 1675 TaxID=3032597 RepID=UPI0023DA0AEF|nr:hypothetical protein [Algoriphagus sp. CAU 1675]MDF2158487.1 hypothetical protein [Algoriphagus sp. CAU 1675]